MPERPDKRGERAITRWVVAAVFVCASVVAAACPLCLGAFRSSAAQQIVSLPQAVLAKPSADGRTYRIVAVIKGERPAGGRILAEDGRQGWWECAGTSGLQLHGGIPVTLRRAARV